jgi:hypothetical protein
MMFAARSILRLATVGVISVALSLFAVACSSQPDTHHLSSGSKSQIDSKYLDGAVGTASEDEVASTLGFPSEKHELDSGGQTWTYKYKYQRTHLIFGHRTLCTEVVLAFTATKILQKWNQENCEEYLGTKSQ